MGQCMVQNTGAIRKPNALCCLTLAVYVGSERRLMYYRAQDTSLTTHNHLKKSHFTSDLLCVIKGSSSILFSRNSFHAK